MSRWLTLLLIPAFCFAKPFRIAVVYPTTTVGHINCTCGYEAACITKAAIKEAQLSGMPIEFDTFQTDRESYGAAGVAQKVVSANYDATVGTLVSTEAIPIANALEAAGIPFITPTATNPEVTQGKQYTLRIPFNDFRQSDSLLPDFQFGISTQKELPLFAILQIPILIFLAHNS